MMSHNIFSYIQIYKSDDIKPDNITQSFKMKNDEVSDSKIWKQYLVAHISNISALFIPVVYAAQPAKPEDSAPKLPPKMKYQDLPIEGSSEVYIYRKHFEEMPICPEEKVKLLHSFLFPIVQTWRAALSASFFGMKNELRDMRNEACEATCKKINEVKEYMRQPENILIRSATLLLSTAAGVYIGSGTVGVTRKMFYGTIGALSAGALCFPKESDEIVRDVSFRVAKIAISMYNSFCGKKIRLRERITCPDELPECNAKPVPAKK